MDHCIVSFLKRTRTLWKGTGPKILKSFTVPIAWGIFLSRCSQPEQGPALALSYYQEENPSPIPITSQTQTITLAPPNPTTKPYRIKGITYTPQQYIEMESIALASHYGKGDGFHGRPTATGERFTMYGLTGAHKTLHLPCLASVTNLENGRSIIVKFNDRGPFIKGRDVDLSWKAASLLGFAEKGLTRVHLKVLVTETLALAENQRALLRKQPLLAAPAPTPAPIILASAQSRAQQPTLHALPKPLMRAALPNQQERSASDVHHKERVILTAHTARKGPSVPSSPKAQTSRGNIRGNTHGNIFLTGSPATLRLALQAWHNKRATNGILRSQTILGGKGMLGPFRNLQEARTLMHFLHTQGIRDIKLRIAPL